MVRRYSRGMRAVISNIVRNPADAEDVLHDMFMTVLVKIRQGDLDDPERLSGYIRTIAKNLAHRHSSKAAKRPLTNIDEVPPPIDPQHGPLEELLLKEKVEIIWQVLGELTQERDRQIIIRYYLLGEDKEAICGGLGLNSVQFDKVKSRAFNRFRELCEKRRSSKRTGNQSPGAK